MSRRTNIRVVVTCSLALLIGSCGDDRPTSPTGPTSTPSTPGVTVTGNWSAAFEGELFSGDGQVGLTHNGTRVTGDWSLPMPGSLVALGAPGDVDLAGSVTGTATPTNAALSFGFLEALAPYFGGTDCALNVDVTSLDAMMMGAIWTTDDSCQRPVKDAGTLTLIRQ